MPHLRPFRALFGLLALAAIIASTGASAEMRVRPTDWARPIVGGGPKNLFQVSTDVYRSAQPDDDDFRGLVKFGVRSVLNLRQFHSDDDEAEDTGLTLYDLPMNAGSIEDQEIIQAMQLVAGAPKPVLVHCWHGSDRTGVVIAMYRMVFQNWPREQAIDEFVNGGYGYHRGVFPGIEDYLRQVDIERIRKAALPKGSVSSAH